MCQYRGIKSNKSTPYGSEYELYQADFLSLNSKRQTPHLFSLTVSPKPTKMTVDAHVLFVDQNVVTPLFFWRNHPSSLLPLWHVSLTHIFLYLCSASVYLKWGHKSNQPPCPMSSSFWDMCFHSSAFKQAMSATTGADSSFVGAPPRQSCFFKQVPSTQHPALVQSVGADMMTALSHQQEFLPPCPREQGFQTCYRSREAKM